jgi:tetratricopeptide (TPR) repeat protein
MTNKTHYLFLLILLLLYACSTQKSVSSNQDYLDKNEIIAKKESTKQLVDFFNAENTRLLGKNLEALNLFNEFLKKYPNNATANYNLARLYFQNKNSIDAEKYAKLASNFEPGNIYFQEFYTQVLVYNNNIKDAEKQYNILIEKNPQNPEYIFRKAQLFLKAKNYDKAVESLTEYENKTGFNEDIIIQKKNIYLILNKPFLAINEIKKMQQNYPSTVDYPILIADIYEAENNSLEVDKIYQSIEENFSNDATAQVALAQYYLSKKNQKEYNRLMLKIMQNKNLSTETKIALIIPSLKKIDSDSISKNDAIIELVKSISTDAPDNKEAILIYANVLSISKQNSKAIEQYNRYLKIDKTNLDIWTQVASLYFDEKMYDSTLSICKNAETYFPNSSILLFYKGITLIQKKEIETAIPILKNAIQFESKNKNLLAQIYSTLGDAFNTLGKYNSSDSSFDEALKIIPNDVSILNNYAYYLSVRNERLIDAEKMSKKSLEIQPNSKSFLDTYGWILYQQGNYEEAKIYIDKAIKSNGEEDGTLFEHLGDVYFKLNDFAKAKEYWQKAVDKGEQNFNLLQKIKTGKINE